MPSLISKFWILIISTTVLSTSGSRSFSSELEILTALVLLPNGILILSYPNPNFSVTWLFIVFSFLLFLIVLQDPPIIAIVFELATVSLLPTELSRYEDREAAGWKLDSLSLAMMNTAVMVHTYLVYCIGRWMVKKGPTTATQTAVDAAAPRFLTGMNVFLEMLILFVSNTALMSSVSSLRFQESTVRVPSGLSMVLFGMFFLISSMVGTPVMMQARMDQGAAQTDNGASDQERSTVVELLELSQPEEEPEQVAAVAVAVADDDQIV